MIELEDRGRFDEELKRLGFSPADFEMTYGERPTVVLVIHAASGLQRIYEVDSGAD